MENLELKYVIEMKNSLERLNSRFELVEERISKFEYILIRLCILKNRKRKIMKKNEQRASEKCGTPK